MKFLKFYADWCGPCKVLTTNLEKAGIVYTPVNADSKEDLCTIYNVRNLPTFIAIDDEEKEIARFTGVKSPDGIKQWIDSLTG